MFCSAALLPSAPEEIKSFIAFLLDIIYDALAMSGFPGISYQERARSFLNLINVFNMVEQFLGGVSGLAQGDVV